jgi:dsRNA-specific ribonuclease
MEAMIHASCSSGGGSLERLEFLGDGVLDRIITTVLYEQEPPLPHSRMHVIRTAVVNADFLAFMCMEWTNRQRATDVVETSHVGDEDATGGAYEVISSGTPVALWRFLRHHSPRLAAEQAATARRHAALRAPIRAAIEGGSRHPWALLARLRAPKWYSDVVESLLGAVYVDSGSWEACRDLLERIGVLGPYLRRMVAGDVHAWHPKEEMGVLAGSLAVRYVVEMQQGGAAVEGEEEEAEEGEEGHREFACRVLVGERVVASVQGGVSREEIQIRAADTAVQALRGVSSEGRTLGRARERERARASELEMAGLE